MFAKAINSFFKKLGIQIKSSRSLTLEKDYYGSVINGFADLFTLHKKYQGAQLNNGISGLVFSKDRAMQLDALLRSYFQLSANPAPLSVLYKASNNRFKNSYRDLMDDLKSCPVDFLEETDFYKQVSGWVKNVAADRVFFATDDAIIVEEFDFNDILQFNPLDTIFSLTKGTDLAFCFNHNRPQKLPDFKEVSSVADPKQHFLEWVWEDMTNSPDWIYPLSLDGTVFLRNEIELLLKNIRFKNPNTLEANLQVFVRAFLPRKGACYPKAKYVNIPCNLVQKEIKNRITTAYTVEELNAIWTTGKRIDTRRFWKLDARTAQTMKFEFK